MKCKEIENGRSCPWEDCPDFDNDWCDNCPSKEDDKPAHIAPQRNGSATDFDSVCGGPIPPGAAFKEDI